MNEVRPDIISKTRSLGIAVVIPTYNNGKTLEAVITGVQAYCRDIFVVNDGSTDDTAGILQRIPDIRVVTHPVNLGKGAGLRNGLTAAREAGFRYAITIDSDGQHYPDDIPSFITEIERTPDTLLVGARNLNADNMPGKNTFANKFSNFWFKLETGIKLQDTQSGYRLYPLNRLGSMKWFTTRYEFELEVLVAAAWNGVPVRDIAIRVYYPPEGERVSHFHPFRDFTRISLVNTVLVLIAALYIWPRNLLRKLSWRNIRKYVDDVLHNNVSTREFVLSVMLGIFMGIVPIWGYQIVCAIFLAHLFKLNKVITVLFSNISIPPMIPFILFGSYATGCLVLGDEILFRYDSLTLKNITQVLSQYLIGSIIFAIICSLVAGAVTYCIIRLASRSKKPH